MLINNKDAAARLSSSSNLMNRLASLKGKTASPMNLFMGNQNKPAAPVKTEGTRTVDISVKKLTNDDIPEVSFNKNSRTGRKESEFLSSGVTNPSVVINKTVIPDPNKENNSLVTTAGIVVPIPTRTDLPTIDSLINNPDEQIKLASAHDNALSIVNDALLVLRSKLEDIKADKLPSVITAASKVVTDIRRERIESAKSGNNKDVHYHFYTPQQKSVSDYEVIDVA